MDLRQLQNAWRLVESKTEKKLRCKVLDDYSVYIVSGKQVRDKHHADFMGGGHHYAYNFIPKNEIWLEELEPTSEMHMILCHEMVELLLMKKLGKDYPNSHKIANNIEAKLREGQKPDEVFGGFIKTYFSNDEDTLKLLVSSYNSF